MLNIREEDFIGKGSHKKCYRHPDDSSKCIKMAYSEEGWKDLKRELEYIEVMNRKGKDYSVLPKYYGGVKTNLGNGYVYDFITNYDGTKCITLEDVIRDETLFLKTFDVLALKLIELKSILLKNEIITMGLWPENIIIQYIDKDNFRLRVINDMGSAALIPLEYYFIYVAKLRVRKRWNRFLGTLKTNYGSKLVDKLVEEIC